jgi:nicotinic acid mononucleotide adenylyltransferase
MAAGPLVVNSFQGAFGPPTSGHYEAMLFSAKQTLLDYPDSQILMLFMPTAASNSKPHLALTQCERISALKEFCLRLKVAINDKRIDFEASDLEYKIFEEKKSSATIHTLRALKTTYPSAKICLTMGIDNLLDLPFWQDVKEYPDHCDRIYILDRNISEEIASKKICKSPKTYLDGYHIYFNKIASWNSNKLPSECKNPILDLSKFTFVKLKVSPRPTSSSLLRIALIKYYGEGNDKYLEALRTLEGREPVKKAASYTDKMIDPWYATFIKSGHLETPEKIAKFNTDFLAAFPELLGGRKRTKKVKKTKRRSRRR